MSKKTSVFELFEDKKGKWRFRLKSANGEIVAQSEAYDSRKNAKRGIKDFLATAAEAAIEDAKK